MTTFIIAAVAEHAGLMAACYCLPLLVAHPTQHHWYMLYSPALSNTDVWLICLIKLVILLAIINSSRMMGALHPQPSLCRQRLVSATLLVTTTCLLVKAALVAVLAPDRLWPSAELNEDGAPLNVGLVLMFAAIGLGLAASVTECWLAQQLLLKPGAPPLQPAPQGAAGLEEPLLSAPNGLHHTAPPPGPLDATAGVSQGAQGHAAGVAAALPAAPTAASPPVGTVTMLLRLCAADMPLLLLAFAAGALAALASTLVPYLVGAAIDAASIEPDEPRFNATVLWLLLVAAASGMFAGVRGGLFTASSGLLNMRMRSRLFAALLDMEVAFFDTHKTAEVMSRLTADTSTVSDQITLELNVFMRSVMSAVVVLIFMAASSWRLTVVTFILVPTQSAIAGWYGEYYAGLARRVQAALADANVVAEEAIASMTTVKAHGAQGSAQSGYDAVLRRYVALSWAEAAAYALQTVVFTALLQSVGTAVLFFGGHLVLEGEMTAGSLISFMLYQGSLTDLFGSFSGVFTALVKAVGAAEQVMALIQRAPELPPAGRFVPPGGVLSGHLELQAVVFSYPARPLVQVLNGLSFSVSPGEVAAFVGPSGGGKSSVFKLVERFYLPQSGVVLIDGRDVGVYEPCWLRRQVALVSQEPVLYARSVHRNIIYGLAPEDGAGNVAPSDEEVEAVARQANAHDFITALPEGYGTDCGEKGSQLSGGQKQRIAIARALVRRPSVLLLDEATSALDADSEAVVQEALDRLMAGRTTLVIAHRLSTIQHASKIFVIVKGVVQEIGSHEQLLRADGVYAALVRRQMHRSPSSATIGPAPGPAGGCNSVTAGMHHVDFLQSTKGATYEA